MNIGKRLGMVLGLAGFFLGTSAPAANLPAPVVFKQNAGWNWFSDNRVLVDTSNGGRILIGSVAGTTDAHAGAGDVQVTTYFLATHATATVTLDAAATKPVASPTSPSDDHLVPVFVKRPDGRYLAVWQHHDVDNLMRWAVSINPNDATSWKPVQTVSANTVDKNGICFSNLFQLSAENNRIYNLTRSVGYDPNYLVSDDNGDTFHYGGHLMQWENPNGAGLGRPYIKYVSNHTDTIFLATTEDHPKDFNNGILAGYIKANMLFKSDGTALGPLISTTEAKIKPTDFTRVFQGSADGVAYINDIQIMPNGSPHLVFSVRKNPAGTDIRYWYARWDGKAWNSHEIAFAGSTIYPEESSYAGVAALDPTDANTLYFSANADPASGKPLLSSADGKRHYEIYEATTKNNDLSWSFAPITQNSAQDNIRPLVPAWDNKHRALLWLQGTMTSYKNYDLNIVGVLQDRR